jgi:hypothetical protein
MKEWIELVTETSKQLVKAVIGRGDTIRLNCLARSESQNNGYTALNVDRSLIQLNFFMLKVRLGGCLGFWFFLVFFAFMLYC